MISFQSILLRKYFVHDKQNTVEKRKQTAEWHQHNHAIKFLFAHNIFIIDYWIKMSINFFVSVFGKWSIHTFATNHQTEIGELN